jgi:hypothetical protein
MALPDLTGLNIEDTYQRILQTDGVNIYDGTGSLVNIVETGSFATTGSNTFTGNQTIQGDVAIAGTASIAYLNVAIESASIIYSSGSNQFGDAANDTQTLYGNIIVPTGSLTVTGSLTATNITPTNITTNYFPKKSGTFLTSSALSSPDDTNLYWGPPSLTSTTPNARTIHIWGLNYAEFALRVSGSSANTGYLMQVRPGGGFAFSNMVYNQQIFSIGSDVAVQALGILGSAGNIEMGRNGGNVGINWPNAYTIPAKFYVSGSSRFDGAVTINGTGTTSATTALNVRNVNASSSLVVLNNGSVYSYGPKFITSNTAFGAGAHNALDSGSNNTAFGVNSHLFLTNGRNNVGVGLNANRSITIADNNTAVGYHALYTNISASGNTAVGSNALNANTAQNNTAIGGFSLNGNTTGDSNTALGYASLFSNVTGGSNTSIGYATFYNLNTGSGNTAVGINAGRYVAPSTSPLSSSNFSVFLGQETRPNSNGETNQIVIGYNAIGLGSNSVVLGNSSITRTALR